MRREYLTALVLVAGFVVVGLTDYALTVRGYGRLGIVVWVVGYGGLVAVAWYRWLRPLEFGADPSGTDDE